MSNCQNLSTKSYQNQEKKTNLINSNDIVKVNNRHYMVTHICEDTFKAKDMYSNEITFHIDDIQSIIFDSSKQTNIYEFINKSKLDDLYNSLKDINIKLKNPMTGLSNIDTLIKLKRNILKQINELELENIEIKDTQETNSLFQEIA